MRHAIGRDAKWSWAWTNRAATALLLGLVAICLLGVHRAHADTVTLSASQDAWIDQGAQTTNHGTDATVHVKGRASSKQRTLVQFGLSSIPACASVSSATLRLHVVANSLSTNVTHNVHQMLSSWTESGVTWLTQDGTNNWPGAAGAQAGTDFVTTMTDDATTGTGTGFFVEWDVTSDVSAFLSGSATNNGWLVKHAVEGGGNTNDNNTVVEYASRENGTEANHPQLVVTFTLSNINCDDSNPCTDDTCTLTGCVYTNNTAPCDDGLFCNGADTCSGGSCSVHAGDPCPGPDGDTNCSESCDEVNDNCLAPDPDGTLCRPAVDECDVAETCLAGACPADGFEPPGIPCGDPSDTECTNPDTCDGAGNCQDNHESSGFPCDDPSDTECTNPDTCDGAGNCQDNHELPTVVCRPATTGGDCDEVEFCDGAGNCPADAVKPANAVCRPDTGECDVEEVCDGISHFCPPDDFEPAGTPCGSSSDTDCDNPDTCDGNNNCQSNNEPDGTPCTDDGETCTADECDGGVCTHPAGNAGVECNAAADLCDEPEECDGINTTCPTDAPKAAGEVCRPAAGECDVAEECDGISFACPVDVFAGTSVTCADEGNPCTVDHCDGLGACVHDPGNAGAICRPAASDCDVEETCDGASAACPVDGFEPSGTPCGSGADTDCTDPDTCDGSGACQSNHEPDGTPCTDDQLFCTGTETCQNGLCTSSGDPCTTGVCDESNDQCSAAGSETSPLAGCRSAARSILLVKDSSDDTKDKMIWKWIKGQPTTQAEVADPTTTADYTLCVFSGTGQDLVAEITVPPGSAKWKKLGSKGYLYKDNTLAEGGAKKILLKGSPENKSKVLVIGKGANLPDLPPAADSALDLDLPVTVQLTNEDNGICFEASFDSGDIKKNVPGKFKAKSQ
jgi:hypothetical protein